MLIYKPTSCGTSFWIPNGQPPLQTRRLLYGFHVLSFELLRQGYVAVLVGQVSGVENFKPSLCEIKEADNVAVFDERFSEIVDLPPKIFPVWVRKEGDGIKPNFPRGNVNVLATWVSPDGVKFGFDENAGALPYGPPDYLFSAAGSDLLWNDREAFVQWLVGERLAEHGYRLLACGDTKTKLLDVRGSDRSSAHKET